MAYTPEMDCPHCGEPFDIYDIRDEDDSPGISAFRQYGCGAFSSPKKNCTREPINKAFRTGWAVVKGQCCDNKRMVERKDGTRRCRTCGSTEGSVVKGEEPIERRTEAKVDALLDAQNLAVPPNKPKKKGE